MYLNNLHSKQTPRKSTDSSVKYEILPNPVGVTF